MDSPAIWRELGAHIRTSMVARGWSARELAVHAGCSHASVSRIEAGRPHEKEIPRTVQQVCAALGIDADHFLTDIRQRQAEEVAYVEFGRQHREIRAAIHMTGLHRRRLPPHLLHRLTAGIVAVAHEARQLAPEQDAG